MKFVMLAQIGVDPRAATSPLIITVAVLAICVCVMIAGVGGFLLLSKSNRRRFLWSLGNPILMAVIVSLLVISAYWYITPRKMIVDFSHGRQIGVVNWPRQRKENFFSVQGDIELKVKLPNGGMYEDRVEIVSFRRQNDVIGRIEAAGRPMTLDAACARIEVLSQKWGFDVHQLAAWRADALTGNMSGYLTYLRATNVSPEISVEILPAVATPDHPWYIMFKAYWPPSIP